MYCKKCGGKVESYASHCPFCGEAMAGNDLTATYTTSIPAQGGHAHKGVGGWILTYIVMGLPLINIIMLLVWAFGNKTKDDPTFRNWARSILVIALISLVLSVVLVLIAGPTLLAILEQYAASMPPAA